MLMSGDYVRILEGFYKGEIGIVKSFDGFMFVIQLLKKALEVKIEEVGLERVPKESIAKEKIIINFDDGSKITLKDMDLRYTSHYLKGNINLKGLYALGKYYTKEEYPNKHESDYFTLQILRLKKFNKNSAEEIAKIFFFFIKKSKKLKEIMSKVDYICFMPNISYNNHVDPWGNILCEKLGVPEISNIIRIPDHKEKELRYYKYKNARERLKAIDGAFQIVDHSLNLKDKSCLILDDICTTGLQISELTSTLARSGVKKIYAIVI